MLQARLAVDVFLSSGERTADRLRQLSTHFATVYAMDVESVHQSARQLLPAYVREEIGANS